ncbi:hypothetical protein SeMB42_g03972 [Synchytrium endobioticum]|uniref:Securin n=1 Tax=Synchytrium endobioticum TaxID=286115 RepID=A0A507DIH0_9FUNG|nr:hypothetical protein SeMB42_g03972 [Synchytrium endobioticum]TPX51462.1 hypothetical protein SeLEV6574_g00277 [Synchytrium endobioticum]
MAALGQISLEIMSRSSALHSIHHDKENAGIVYRKTPGKQGLAASSATFKTPGLVKPDFTKVTTTTAGKGKVKFDAASTKDVTVDRSTARPLKDITNKTPAKALHTSTFKDNNAIAQKNTVPKKSVSLASPLEAFQKVTASKKKPKDRSAPAVHTPAPALADMLHLMQTPLQLDDHEDELESDTIRREAPDTESKSITLDSLTAIPEQTIEEDDGDTDIEYMAPSIRYEDYWEPETDYPEVDLEFLSKPPLDAFVSPAIRESFLKSDPNELNFVEEPSVSHSENDHESDFLTIPDNLLLPSVDPPESLMFEIHNPFA